LTAITLSDYSADEEYCCLVLINEVSEQCCFLSEQSKFTNTDLSYRVNRQYLFAFVIQCSQHIILLQIRTVVSSDVNTTFFKTKKN